MSVATHTVPAYVPEARGAITHDVVGEHEARPEETPASEMVPCCGYEEVAAVERIFRINGLKNIRVVRRDQVA